jgi:hypothetical protein
VSVADRNQFEGFEDEAGFASEAAARPEGCAVCEAMLPEAVDGALSEAEQRAFDQHVAGCAECARELAEAKRGAAWLSMLKTETPQPPVGMLERILAGTTGLGMEVSSSTLVGPIAAPASAMPAKHSATPPKRAETAPEWAPRFVPARPAVPAWALSSVWRRAMGAFRVENARASFQPRLAMTAAMAFFSIALTLNLTGVRLHDLRASDFTPSGLRRTVADESASATRSFQNMRVVYQVESRVSELRGDEASNQNQDASGDPGPDASR